MSRDWKDGWGPLASPAAMAPWVCMPFKSLLWWFFTHSPWPKVLTFCEHGLEGEGKGSHKQLLEKEVRWGRGDSCDLSFSYFLLKIMGYTLRNHRAAGLISCSLCTAQLRDPLWPSLTGSCKCSIRVVSSHRRTGSLRSLYLPPMVGECNWPPQAHRQWHYSEV